MLTQSLNYMGTTHEVAPRGAQRGEATGEVLCPLRLAHIAEMRCGEYQVRDGCRFGCPNAVKPARVAELREALKDGGHEPWRKYGPPLYLPLSKGENKRGSRPRLRAARRPRGSIVHYGHCVGCGHRKSDNPSPRCHPCAAALRRTGHFEPPVVRELEP